MVATLLLSQLVPCSLFIHVVVIVAPSFDCNGVLRILGTNFQVLEWNTLVVPEGATLIACLCVLVRVIIRVVFLSDGVHIGCNLLCKWDGGIFLGVKMHQVL
jgi:hypothetical protein